MVARLEGGVYPHLVLKQLCRDIAPTLVLEMSRSTGCWGRTGKDWKDWKGFLSAN